MIKVEEVVNKNVTDLHISYKEPDISMTKNETDRECDNTQRMGAATNSSGGLGRCAVHRGQ